MLHRDGLRAALLGKRRRGVARDACRARRSLPALRAARSASRLAAHKRPLRDHVLQIADVRAQHDTLPRRDRDRVLHLPAHAQHRLRQLSRQLQRRRRISARPPEQDRITASTETHHRVVDRPCDQAIVPQEPVGDRAQPYPRLAIIGAQRLLGQIGTGRHRAADRQSSSGSTCTGA